MRVSRDNWGDLPTTDCWGLLQHISIHLHNALIGQARQCHDYTSSWLDAANLGRLVLGEFSTHVSTNMRLFTLMESANSSESIGVQFMCCERALSRLVDSGNTAQWMRVHHQRHPDD